MQYATYRKKRERKTRLSQLTEEKSIWQNPTLFHNIKHSTAKEKFLYMTWDIYEKHTTNSLTVVKV